MLPTGIYLAALKPYHAAQEMKEHIFEGSLINENQGRVVNIPTLHIVLDVLCIEMYLCAIKMLWISIVLHDILLI